MRGVVVALDLEGTLISNAISAFPRFWLRGFVETATATAERVVMFTTVREGVARPILRLLAEEGHLPAAFANTVEFVEWDRRGSKDLALIPDARPTLLVDDQPTMVHPGQEDRWIRVAEFVPPYNEDGELARVAGEILRRCAAAEAVPPPR